MRRLARVSLAVALMLGAVLISLWVMRRSGGPTRHLSDLPSGATGTLVAPSQPPPERDGREIRPEHGPNQPTTCDVAYLELQRRLVQYAQCKESADCALISLPLVFGARRAALMHRWFDNPDLTERQVQEFGLALPGATRGIRRDRVERFQQKVALFHQACPLVGPQTSIDEGSRAGCVEGLCVFAAWIEDDPPPGMN